MFITIKSAVFKHILLHKQSRQFHLNGFDWNPLFTNGTTSDGSRPRVSGKYTLNKPTSPKQTIANGINTNAPHACCKLGNAMPMRKLHVHDDKLPSAIAAGLGPLSKSSEKSFPNINNRLHHTAHNSFTWSNKIRNRSQAHLIGENISKNCTDTGKGQPREWVLKTAK